MCMKNINLKLKNINLAVVIPEIFRTEIREIIFAEVAEGMNSNSDKTDPMRGMSRLLLSWNTTES